jgi:hypothetical protein
MHEQASSTQTVQGVRPGALQVTRWPQCRHVGQIGDKQAGPALLYSSACVRKHGCHIHTELLLYCLVSGRSAELRQVCALITIANLGPAACMSTCGCQGLLPVAFHRPPEHMPSPSGTWQQMDPGANTPAGIAAKQQHQRRSEPRVPSLLASQKQQHSMLAGTAVTSSCGTVPPSFG